MVRHELDSQTVLSERFVKLLLLDQRFGLPLERRRGLAQFGQRRVGPLPLAFGARALGHGVSASFLRVAPLGLGNSSRTRGDAALACDAGEGERSDPEQRDNARRQNGCLAFAAS